MFGFFHIFNIQDIYYLNIIKTNKENLVDLNSNGFSYFGNQYSIYHGISMVELLEMDDNFIEFISDIDIFVTTNKQMSKGLEEIIDSCTFIDETNTKDIYTIAKEYNIKLEEANKRNNTVLIKVVLMAYKKKIIDKQKATQIKEEVKKPTIIVKDTSFVTIEGVTLSLNLEEESRAKLSPNADKVFLMLQEYSKNEENINIDNLIDTKFKKDFNLFFKLMLELANAEIIENNNYLELRNVYFSSKQNEQYQNYLSKSIEKGIDVNILKEQIELLLLKAS